MLKSIHLSGLRVYSLSAGKTQPEFAIEAAKQNKSLRYNEEYKHRIELLQSFDFPISSQKLLISNDKQFIAAVGIYPPEIRMYDTSQLSLKFIRRLDNEVIDFLFLSEDYKKLVFLQNNRCIEFHAQGGRHHMLQIPRSGRALCYSHENAELYVVGASNSIYRLDLEQGQFLEPLSSRCDELSCCFLNPCLPIFAAGGSNSTVECWDTRTNKAAAALSFKDDSNNEELEVTSGSFSADGMKMAVGLSNGIVKVFDIRSSRPVMERNHKNEEAIRSVQWISTTAMANAGDDGASEAVHGVDRCIVSNDKHSVKLWNDTSGDILASIESNSIAKDVKQGSNLTIHNVTFYPNSGLCFIPCEQTRIGVCFIPAVGLAPRWCSFLDSVTEELETANGVTHGLDEVMGDGNSRKAVAQSTVYDDYQFLTRQQLEQLGVSQLIGTPMLRAYMHGYFMDTQLYRKIKDITEPFVYEEYRKEKIRKKMEEKKPMRIMKKKPEVIVNAEYAEKLAKSSSTIEGSDTTKKKKKAMKQMSNILTDERFSKLFTHPDFTIETLPLQN